jgi:hypothetical protein
MELLEKGALVVGPTDKGYKIYLSEPASEESIAERMREWEEKEVPEHMEGMKKHNHTEAEMQDALSRERENTRLMASHQSDFGKFYTMHFSEQQGDRFKELVTAGKVKFGYPGYFYRPIFIPMTVGE